MQLISGLDPTSLEQDRKNRTQLALDLYGAQAVASSVRPVLVNAATETQSRGAIPFVK